MQGKLVEKLRVAACIAVLSGIAFDVLAAEAAHDETELAKQTQNPVADLISLPFQFNFTSGGDLDDETLFNVNFQPVVPVALSADWKVIARAVVPYLDIPAEQGSETGLGDIQAQFFITPAKPGALVWGAGPVFSLPTATNPFSRTGTWAAGVGVVLVKSVGPFVVGGLVNQFWPVHDTGGAPQFDQLQIQPFVNYNFGKGWAIAFAPLISANWDADGQDERWTIPLGLGLSRTTHFRSQPLTLGVQIYNNVERPTGTGATQLKFVFSLLFPQ